MDIKVQEEKDLKYKKPIIIFGKDIREIKCFRNSFLFGITGGIVGGLVCFLATSKPLFSTHFGFGSTWFCVFAYWFPCRYKYESNYMKMEYWKKQAAIKDSKEYSAGNSSETEN